MFYSTHLEYEPEIEINLKSSGVEDRFYTHITCWDNLLQPLFDHDLQRASVCKRVLIHVIPRRCPATESDCEDLRSRN